LVQPDLNVENCISERMTDIFLGDQSPFRYALSPKKVEGARTASVFGSDAWTVCLLKLARQSDVC